jgi:hypothetical protein
MKSSAIKTQNIQMSRGSLLEPRALPNMVKYFSADLDTAASGSDVSIKDFISGSSIAGGDSGSRGAALAATSGPTNKRAYDFDTGVYNLGNFNSQASNFAFTMVTKVTDTATSGEGQIVFKSPTEFGLGSDFSIKYKVNIDTGGSDPSSVQGKIINSLNFTSDINEPQTNAINNMLRSYHVMTVVQANGKMTLRFNGQQHRQVTNSGLTTNLDFLIGDDTADGSSDAGSFDTPEFMVYTLSDPTSFADVIAIENYLQKKYDIGFRTRPPFS